MSVHFLPSFPKTKQTRSILVAFTFTFVCFATPTLAQFSRNRQERQNCVTPENYYGSCVALSYCPQVTQVFQLTDRRTAKNYVIALQRSCGTRNIGGDPLVCCTRPITAPVTERPNPFFPTTDGSLDEPWPVSTETPPRNPFLNPTTQTTTVRTTSAPITSAPVTSAPIVEARGTPCRVPPGKLGECVDIKSCPSILNELKVKGNDPEFVKYVQASNLICKRIGTNVCCPTGQTEATPAPVTPANYDTIPRRLPTVEEGCGYTLATNKKIVGGVVSKKGAWPWIALLGYFTGSKFKCGGTLITARHVITAAHCLLDSLAFVRLGEHDLSTDTEARHIDIQIVKKVAHPEYNRVNGRSDMAILYLERNVEFTNLILPICMPSAPSLRVKSYVGTFPFVAGWGKTMEDGESATVLNELMIPVMENEVCRNSYAKLNLNITADQFDRATLCAGVLSGGKDTCQGDSGGPLMTSEGFSTSMRFYLIGIVSYGKGCARPEVPGVYTSTQFFMDWILEKVEDTP